jgi:hypothetical protein
MSEKRKRNKNKKGKRKKGNLFSSSNKYIFFFTGDLLPNKFLYNVETHEFVVKMVLSERYVSSAQPI